MERTDSHTHTWLSRHGRGTVDEVVAAAVGQGMTMVALTEHLPLPPEVDTDGTFAMEPSRVDEYLTDIAAARLAYPNIEIITGVEIDWRWGGEDFILAGLAEHPFELRLGSVHMLTGPGIEQWEFDHPDYADGWLERGEAPVWEAYFKLWTEAIASAVPFDIMTHPDLPKKLNHKPTFDPRELYAAMAEAVAARGLMIEMNTSGLRKPVHELYPAPALLRAFFEAGVPCTIGSDAHTPADVGCDFDAGYAALREAGYRVITVPTRSGDRREIPLD
jgi:histidinol-phosphatase (PHP family)